MSIIYNVVMTFMFLVLDQFIVKCVIAATYCTLSLAHSLFKSSKCFTSHGYISCLTQIATGLGARRRCSSSAPGHCQSQLEGFEGTGLDYAGVKLVPGDYGSWEKRLFVLFGVIAWNFN